MATKRWIAAAAAVITTLATVALSPPAWADPDPHIPNGDAGWCPGGQHSNRISGGGKYCLGLPFANGDFYAQSFAGNVNPFAPGSWLPFAKCSVMVDGMVEGGRAFGSPQPNCDGGPDYVNW